MTLTINKQELIQALKVVAGFADRRGTRTPVLQMVNVVNEEGQVYFYATDKYKAVKYRIKWGTFQDLTSFKLDPYFILDLLHLYPSALYDTVTIHTEIAENIYYIDIGEIKNIQLPRVNEGKYPSLSGFFDTLSEQENLIGVFDTKLLLSTLNQYKKAGCEKVKIIRCSDRMFKILGIENDSLEAVVVECKVY